MKRKIKLSLMLMTLIVLMPIFTGCPDDSADLKVVRMSDGDQLSRTEDGTFEIDLDDHYNYIKYDFEINEKVGSYRIVYGESTRGSGSYKNIGASKCYEGTIKYGVATKKSTFKKNYDYRLTFELYEDKTCSTEPYDSVSYFLHTYVANKQNELKNILDVLRSRQEYCNLDYNGNYNVLYHENLFAQIAYSQVDYKGHEIKSNINNCDNGERYGFYNKFGSSQNAGNISIDFVKWVAKKAGILSELNKNLILPKNGEQILSWAQQNDRFFESSLTVDVGDLVIAESVSCYKGKEIETDYLIGIAYQKEKSGAVVRVHGRYVFIFDKGPGFKIEVGYFEEGDIDKKCKGDELGYIDEIGYINMEGIAY